MGKQRIRVDRVGVSAAILGFGALLAGCVGTDSMPGSASEPEIGALSASGGETSAGSATVPPSVDPEHRVRGVSLSAPRRPMTADALDPAAAAGASWVAVVPYAFVDPQDPEVSFDRARQFWGETSEGVARTIEYARASGLATLLKPHLWVRGQGWPGGFVPDTPEGWETFLSGYRGYVLRFAHIADSMNVEMFSVGTEVDLVALERPDYWRALIADVRRVYGGRLTYAANWDKYAEIEFWDDLDLVGVDAYFPLLAEDTPGVDALVEAWSPWRDELREVARRTGKPILFAEYGYRSMDGAAGNQWELPDGRRGRGIPANDAVQAAAYEALFRVLWDRPWFAGGFAWKWYAGSPPFDDWLATDYTPQGKPAETVMASWYGGDASHGGRRVP